MSDLLVWNELGTIYFKIGCFEEACTAFEKAIELAPECGWPYSNLGLTYAHQGKYADAISLYRKSVDLLKSSKDKAISWNRMGDAYRHLNDGNKAMMAYQKAVELDVGELEEAACGAQAVPALEPQGLAADPIDDLEASSSATPSQEAPISEDLAEWLKGLEDQVAPAGEQRESQADQDLQAWLEASASEAAQENPSETAAPAGSDVSSHDWVLDTNVPIEPQPPYFPRLNKVLGEPLDRTLPPVHRRPPCNPDATDHSDLEPSDRFKLLVKGALPLVEAAKWNGQALAGSLEVLEQVEPAEDPLRQEVRSSLGCLDEAPAPQTSEKRDEAQAVPTPPHRSELEQAIAAYQNVTENSPANDRAWDALGNSLRADGRYDEAVVAFERAISLAPEKDEYYYHVGLVYAAQQRYDEAITSFQKVLSLNPEDALAHAALAGTYRRLGQEEEAAKHIQIAQPLMDGEREYNRACFEAICGNKDQAIKLLEFALETKQTPLEWVLADPDLEPIHEDLRFKALVR
jgi:tetratricopeptide (TPR) repeat protein